MEINAFNLIWSIISYYLAYKIGYYIITTGLKRFEIENVSNNKVRVYILTSLIIGLFFDSTILPLVAPFINSIHNKIVLIFILSIGSSLMTFLIAFLFFKYYFLLLDKKLWQLSLYIASITLIITLVINGLLAIL